MQSVNAIMPENGMTATKSRTADPSKKVTESFGAFMAGTQGDDRFKSTASVMDNISRISGVRQSRKAVRSDNAFTASDSTSQTVQNTGRSTAADTGKTFSTQDFAKVEKEIGNAVRDVMNMDEDTFTQTMAAMGITAIQLLQPEVLQQFVVLAGGGTDMTELLTSETLMDQFTQLTEALLDIDWNALIGLDLADAAEDLSMDALLQQIMDQLTAQSEDGFGLSDATWMQSETVVDDAVSGGTEPVLQDELLENAQGSVVSEKGLKEATTEVSSTDDSTVIRTEETVQGLSTGAMDETASEAGSHGASSDSMWNQQTAAQTSYHEDSVTAFSRQEGTMLNFVENMVQAANQAEQLPEAVNMQQMIDIVNQVVERLHSSMQDGQTTLEMQLNPERLGRMLVSVTSREGVMTANFTVQNEEARAALESQIISLRENLEQRNLKVDAVEVSVSDFTFSQSGQADTGDQKDFNQGNGKRARFDFEAEDEETADAVEEPLSGSVPVGSGSTVDFTA
ncbi:flagellar hook-length control protein FliK [Jutongia sp.]